MRRRRRLQRGALAIAVALLAAGGSGDAIASPSEVAQTGTLTMTSDAGDFVGDGMTYSYATPDNVFFAVSRDWNGANNMINVTMRTDPSSLDYWMLDFAAPPGQALVAGSYPGVARAGASQNSGQPGLDVSGLGRGCNMLGGSFSVLDAAFGPYGYVERFHATFEQHCEFGVPALRGDVSVSNPPPPPPLTATIALDSPGQLRRGAVSLTGSVTCNRDSDADRASLQLTLSEPSKKGAVTGAASIPLPSGCSPVPTRWQVTVTPSISAAPFTKGTATASVNARLGDPFFGVDIETDPMTSSVALKEA